MDAPGLTTRGVGTKVAAVFEGFGWRIAGLVCEELNLGTVDDSRKGYSDGREGKKFHWDEKVSTRVDGEARKGCTIV